MLRGGKHRGSECLVSVSGAVCPAQRAVASAARGPGHPRDSGTTGRSGRRPRVGRDAADAGRRGAGQRHHHQVTVADDTDVDEGSIQAEDFSLSDGDLESINVTESGSNATVNLFLDSGINADTVTVRSPADGNVTDAAGNALADDSVTVTGMDSRLPYLREFRLERVNESAAKILARSNEPLAGLSVEVRGPTSANLTRNDFRAVDDNVFGVPHDADRPVLG